MNRAGPIDMLEGMRDNWVEKYKMHGEENVDGNILQVF